MPWDLLHTTYFGEVDENPGLPSKAFDPFYKNTVAGASGNSRLSKGSI